MKNYLESETSPYLLQHADNPVHWYPWTPEAFEKAKTEDKPVFLSIGYSTCHWCHVMAHESFEDEKTAEILNRHFIAIKVDREERPDIDSVYMSVCQAFTGRGGWPMSIFMTWDQKPFFAGTYFPARPQNGMPSFADLLNSIAAGWKQNRSALMQSAGQIVSLLRMSEYRHTDGKDQNQVEIAVQSFVDSFDSINGGFGGAPKFPAAHNLIFLTLFAVQKQNPSVIKMVRKTLTQMRLGGLFDQIGYGFSRYSTDRYFLVPHFEKMLYDNALLIMAYTSAYCATGESLYLDTAEKTAEYIAREMTGTEGEFYSAQDADSEGVEGKYYTFSLQEIRDVLGEEMGNRFAQAYNITRQGNFEGKNIPNRLQHKSNGEDFQKEIRILYDYRQKRMKLHLDDKILTAWNSLMTVAYAILFRASGEEKYLKAAKQNQLFLERHLVKHSRIYTSWREGRHSDTGFLDDYAYYITALIELYHSTLDHSYLQRAEYFCKEVITHFTDHENGGFFLCETDQTELFMNPKESYDGAMPSGNSVMAYNLVRLSHITGQEKWKDLAGSQLAFLAEQARDYPAGYSLFLLTKLLYDNPPVHITIVPKLGQNPRSLTAGLPFLADISVVAESAEYPLLNGESTYYICKDHTCYPPSNRVPF